jgi:hypothetical protein
MSQHYKISMGLMRIILARSVYSLIVYISCIMQYVNNILIVSKSLRKSVPESRETQFRAFVCVQHLYGKNGVGIFCEACED